MTGDSPAGGDHLPKFQQLLRELFQFDCADLDFGIYRIMNHKRDAVQRFISDQLPSRIAAELETGHLARQSQAMADLERERKLVLENIASDAIDADGNLDDKYSGTFRGKEYLKAQAAAQPGRGRQAVETDTYNHLYTFFSRYYQDGDFVSKRRYSRSQRYAIPYNGEEVYLHWANSDQYYVKTAEHFNNYDWTATNGVTVRFRLEAANVEQDNVKGDRRFFVPLHRKTDWNEDARAVTIPFEYRPLTAQEATRYGARSQQDKIIEAAVDEIPRRLNDAPDALAALMREHRRNGQDEPVSLLEHHLRQYTRRNDSDFFIHKDLSGFLSRELDFYLKNEVLNLDNLESAGERAADGWFQQMRLIKSVGGEIIDFLAQIEGFQKMLWEKRKFVVDTQYCVTLGSIDPDFYQEIAANEAQWEEWRELLGVDPADRSVSFLKSQPTLPLDTRHFDADFTDRLLASFDDIDGMTDGLLIHSENWQALRLLDSRYAQSAQCVYIDPPYNSKTSAILYKNDYRHSSWLSLIDSRIALSRTLSTPTGSHIIAIDENEQVFLGQLLMQRFPDHSNICVSIVHNKKGIQGDHLSYNHDFAYFSIPKALKSTHGRAVDRSDWDYVQLRKWGRESERSTAKNCFYPILVEAGEVVGYGDVCDDTFHPGKSNVLQPGGRIAVYPVDPQGVERKWRYARDSIEGIRRLLKVHTTKSGEVQIRKANDEQQFKTVWDDSRYIAGDYGTKWLTDLDLKVQDDIYPKSIHTVEDSVHLSSDRDSLTIDYFAGSGTTGHAVINLNREDGGERKFILVEMGGYFDTVLLPRIKKVTFSPEWKNGDPKREATTEEADGSPRIVKYMRLESYEDALNGIGFGDDDEEGQLKLEESIDGYLLKYMLKWETKHSETLLNARKLTSPFDYRLRTHANGETRERTADVAETFAYLLGLKVRTRQVHDDKGRRYLVYCGETREAPGREVAVVWRETEGWTQEDFARDRQFVNGLKSVKDADVVYVNGDSVIPGAKAVEPIFKARMFAAVSA